MVAARQAWLPAAAGSLEMVGCWHICCRDPSTADFGLRAAPKFSSVPATITAVRVACTQASFAVSRDKVFNVYLRLELPYLVGGSVSQKFTPPSIHSIGAGRGFRR